MNHNVEVTGYEGRQDARTILLWNQVRLQKEFQALLQKNQNPSTDCGRQRIYMDEEFDGVEHDGFTLELHAFGRLLLAALATDRTFVMWDKFTSAYSPPNCIWSSSGTKKATAGIYNNDAVSSWTCPYEPRLNCTETMSMNSTIEFAPSGQTASLGIFDYDGSDYFNSEHYSAHRIEVGDWTDPVAHIDHVEHYERAMGRFWVRSQTQHYLWRPSAGLKREMKKRLPHNLDHNYIGMHIRFSDNIVRHEDFWRNVTVSRSLDNFMSIAEKFAYR